MTDFQMHEIKYLSNAKMKCEIQNITNYRNISIPSVGMIL